MAEITTDNLQILYLKQANKHILSLTDVVTDDPGSKPDQRHAWQ
jgi:hypothetical protein